MKRLLAVLTVIVLPGLFAVAQEPGKQPAAPDKVVGFEPKPGAPFFEKFDLNKDGKVDWEEYRKVTSGFATLDADRDGAITQADMAKVMEQRQQKMQQAMRQRMRRGMRGGFGRFDGGGFGGAERPCPWCDGGGPRGRMGPGGGPGQRGPMGPGGGWGGGGGSGRGMWEGPWGPRAPQPPATPAR